MAGSCLEPPTTGLSEKDHAKAKLAGDQRPFIGLYGVSGCGKTTLLYQLKENLGEHAFAFHDGSKAIKDVFSDNFETFDAQTEKNKVFFREKAIGKVEGKCTPTNQIAVVAGHYALWSKKEEAPVPIYTNKDLATYTHILYLDVPANEVAERRRKDSKKTRENLTEKQLEDWQEFEKKAMRHLCRNHGILFTTIPSAPEPILNIKKLLIHFRDQDKTRNELNVQKAVDGTCFQKDPHPKIMLVMDADKTMTAQDTGKMFWKAVSESSNLVGESNALTTLFSSLLEYSYIAFCQALLLYEETANDEEYENICEEVAKKVTMYPDFVKLLKSVEDNPAVGAMIVTSGLLRVWQLVLKAHGVHDGVKVIGGGRLADTLIITPKIKGKLTTYLREHHSICVWAFGDSPVDIKMLKKAHQAVIVVGDKHSRSASMDGKLSEAYDLGLRAWQVLLPKDAPPRLDTNKLPLINLIGTDSVASIMEAQKTETGRFLKIILADKEKLGASQLLASAMRDSTIAGNNLREAHRRAGFYLAVEHLTTEIGMEERTIKHVQGNEVKGCQLLHEERTTIVAMMRGGEPMAFGVSDAFPLAMFVHAKAPDDLKLHHLRGQSTVILVDSVVHSGRSVKEFVEHVRTLHATIRVFIVAGTVQAKCIKDGTLNKDIGKYADVNLVALRTSDTSFVGTRTIDTGNRLFNTTRLP
ncbi:uncharacterized protein KY384_000106 [Bacidia gigantensis]|uniref:uncharacterized protein n=1 Tax=Bacidia gigantensis TaxID=2732470 RepID=UPI001D037DAB|nr:uncharacterized protein KY384_000106 [Bacidia gigantensis]KAG8526113.1 hypothetical protein KY384_000106 [Bacidia gigantensis]